MRTHQICRNYVMDTTDSQITVDDKGVCDHYNMVYNKMLPNRYTDERVP